MSCPDCIAVVFLKNCEPELLYILAELFWNMSERVLFSRLLKGFISGPKNFGERSTAKSYHPLILLSVVSKVFEKLVNDKIVDHLEKCGLFSDFYYGFRSFRLTADYLTVVSDRIARAFKWSGATPAVALDVSKAFDRAWHAFFTNLSLMKFPVRYLALFHLFSVTGSFGWFWIKKNIHKNIQLMLEFFKGPTLFLLLH